MQLLVVYDPRQPSHISGFMSEADALLSKNAPQSDSMCLKVG
jgi:hypothetical protein